MRVTFVVAALDMGGGIRVIAQYAEGLRQRGHEVTIVVRPHRGQGILEKVRNHLPFAKPRQVKSHFDGTGVTVKVLERHRPVLASDVPPGDVIIATWWETAEWIAQFPDDRGRKFYFVQDYEVWTGHKERVDATLKLPMRKITISRWLETLLAEQFGQPSALVPNGVDRALFYSDEREMPDRFTVGFVYANNPRKGTDIAIDAVKLAREAMPGLRCIAFGHAEPLESMSLPSFVEYHISPSQDRLRELYGSCSVWLFPSREEGFGLPLLEAMACGTPVIATPAGAAPEIIDNGGGHLLGTYKVEDMMRSIIDYAILSKSEWKVKSEEAKSISIDFSLAKSVESFCRCVEIN